MSDVDDHPDDKDRGLIEKYDVTRRDDPEGKHSGCFYFVLDPEHDSMALAALKTYVTHAHINGYESLCYDLMRKISEIEKSQQTEVNKEAELRERLGALKHPNDPAQDD